MSDKTYSLEECKKHNTDKDCWLVIHGKVYDVTDFLEEHPGGFDILLTVTGKDATVAFEEIGHSKSAKKLLEKYLIGDFEGGDVAAAVPAAAAAAPSAKESRGTASPAFHVIIPLLILAIALGIHLYNQYAVKA